MSINPQRRASLLRGLVWLKAGMLLPWGVALPWGLARAQAPAGGGALGGAKNNTTGGQAAAPVSEPLLEEFPELFAYPDALFRCTRVQECLSLLAAGQPLRTGAQANALVLELPDMADNGAAVPVGVRWQGPWPHKPGQACELALLVEHNPLVLSVHVRLFGPALPALKTRLKLNQSSQVYAFLKIDNRCYVASKPVRVTLGGCVA